MARKFLVLPRIHFRGATAQPAWWCTGAPGPLAARGFSNALLMAAGGPEALAWVKGAGLVYHDVDLRAERIGNRIHPHQLRAATFIDNHDYVGSSTALSAQPTVRCDGIATIVVALDAQAPIDADAVTDFLRRGRFAGGAIQKHRFDPTKPIVVDSLAEVTRAVRAGFAFHDRTDLLQLREGERDPLDAFMRATREDRTLSEKEAKTSEQPAAAMTQPTAPASSTGNDPPEDSPLQADSWLHPYLAGFRRLTSIDRHARSRDGHPHAFAEPLVGLGQLVSLRTRPMSIWDYSASNGLHLVTPVA